MASGEAGGNGCRGPTFEDGAEDRDGSELLEDVGVAEDGSLDGVRIAAGLVSADRFDDWRRFSRREIRNS